MKKSFLLGVLALSMFSISCNEDNNERPNEITQSQTSQKNASFFKLPQVKQKELADTFFKSLAENKDIAGKPRGFCHDFEVEVGIGIFTVTTTITVCCTTLTMNCTPIPKVVVNKLADDEMINEFEVKNSSVYETKDGQKIKIKEGLYDISSGTVQFELVEVK